MHSIFLSGTFYPTNPTMLNPSSNALVWDSLTLLNRYPPTAPSFLLEMWGNPTPTPAKPNPPTTFLNPSPTWTPRSGGSRKGKKLSNYNYGINLHKLKVFFFRFSFRVRFLGGKNSTFPPNVRECVCVCVSATFPYFMLFICSVCVLFSRGSWAGEI